MFPPFIQILISHTAIKNLFFQNMLIKIWKSWEYLQSETPRAARTCLLLIKYLNTSSDGSIRTSIALSMANQAALIFINIHYIRLTPNIFWLLAEGLLVSKGVLLFVSALIMCFNYQQRLCLPSPLKETLTVPEISPLSAGVCRRSSITSTRLVLSERKSGCSSFCSSLLHFKSLHYMCGKNANNHVCLKED